MKDSRYAEIAWLVLIAVLVALGTSPVLAMLGRNRAAGNVVLGALIAGAVIATARAYDPSSATARADVTKGIAYCAAAVLALITVDWNPHWAIRACITAAEVAIIFDIVTISVRPSAAAGK